MRSKGVFDDVLQERRPATRSNNRGDYHTVGDIAYWDDEGYLYICDRKNDMIISGGMNIYPAEIEAALEQHPGIYDVAVFGIPSEEWGEHVHATCVPAPGVTLTEATSSPTPASTWPTTRSRARWPSSTSCPAPARARSSSASSGPPTRRPHRPGRLGQGGRPPRPSLASQDPLAPYGMSSLLQNVHHNVHVVTAIRESERLPALSQASSPRWGAPRGRPRSGWPPG